MKEDIYDSLVEPIALMALQRDAAILSRTSALLQEKMGFWWTGFYLVEDRLGDWKGLDTGVAPEQVKNEEIPSGKGPWMTLGPSVGPPACERIRFGRGVCGTAWAEKRTVVVPDVDEFPGHIACSGETRSEIVVPVFKNGEVAGVLDIDSREPANFDEVDAEWLERIAALISSALS